MLEYYEVYSNDDPELTLPYFTARSNLVLYAFALEKGKTIDFLETIVVYELKVATGDRSEKKFLLTSKLCPLVAVCSLPRGYIRLQRDFFETCNKWVKAFLLTSKFCPLGAVCPCPRAIYMYWIMKKNVWNQTTYKEIILKLATNDQIDKMFLLTSKFCPQWVFRPCPGVIYMYIIMKKIV